LICLLVALVFWVAIKDTKVGDELKTQWANIVTALQSSSGS
jgi:Flp pilus assembly pilin Flp